MGEKKVRQRDFAEAVLCGLGGPPSLLPLLPLLDLPLPDDGLDSLPVNSGNIAPSSRVSDPTDAAAVLELIQSSLRHALGAQAMLAGHGFALMGHALRCMSPAVWDVRSFAALESLGDSLQHSEELHRSFFINVYLNFPIWVYAPVIVQKHVLGHIAKIVTGDRAPYFRKMISVQRIVDGLRCYYSLGSPVVDVLKSVSGDKLGERPRGAELLMLRSLLLQTARSLMCGQPSEEEIKALLLCMTDSSNADDGAQASDDCEAGVDIVQLLLALLNEPGLAVTTAKHLLVGGLGPLVDLVGSKTHKKNRDGFVWAIKLVSKLLQVASTEKELLQLMGGPAARDACLLRLKSGVVVRKLTRDLYFALLELGLECVDTAALSNPLRPSEPQLLRNGIAIAAILELLCRDDRPLARQRALSDLLGLLTAAGPAGRHNRAVLIRHSGWEARVLAVLAMCGPSHNDANGDDSVAMDVVSVLLQHSILEGDSASVTRLFATIDLLADGGHFDGLRECKMLSERAAEALAREQAAVVAACRSVGTESLQKWLEIVEHICMPSSLGGAASLALLAETALIAATSSASSSSAASSAMSASSLSLFGLCVRFTLHAVTVATRALDASNVARREERMSEIEALLLAGQTEVAQPMVEV